jgi:hypothetical protein
MLSEVNILPKGRTDPHKSDGAVINTVLERRGRDSNPRQKLPPVTP